MAEYVALLRGINVGGNNIIKMTELKACFEEMGFTDGVTYIASGNVLFKASPDNPKRLTTVIERGLSKRFGYTSRIVLVSHKQLKHAVEKAPRGFGKELAKYRYNVIFLKEPLRLAFGAHGAIIRVARLASLSLTHGIASGSSRKRRRDVARGIFHPSVVDQAPAIGRANERVGGRCFVLPVVDGGWRKGCA